MPKIFSENPTYPVENHFSGNHNEQLDEIAAVNKIKIFYKKFQATLRAKREAADPSNIYVQLNHPSKNLSYYFLRKNGQFYETQGNKYNVPVLYCPQETVTPPVYGSFKQLTHRDKRYVALKPYSPKKDGQYFEAKDFNDDEEKRNLALFSGLRSMQWGRVVGPQLMIAPNAGLNLKTKIDDALKDNKGPDFPLNSFRKAAFDLLKLHERGAVIGDIKPENMCYQESRGNNPCKIEINFIDLDECYMPGLLEKYNIVYTPLYRPYALANSVFALENHVAQYSEDLDDECEQQLFAANKVFDEYALLLTIAQTTSKDLDLILYLRSPDSKENIPNTKNYYTKFDDTRYFENWIRQHVKPEYQQDVKELLTKPGRRLKRYLESTQKPIHLVEMLNFTV